MASLKISKNSIISIEKFITDYYGVEYSSKDKLTHRNMEVYLFRKGISNVKKINFNNVKKELVSNGTQVVVKDNNNQILVYENPQINIFVSLLAELRTVENIKKAKNARLKNLKEMGIKEAKNGIVNVEDLEDDQFTLENPNRQKVLCRGFRKNYQTHK